MALRFYNTLTQQVQEFVPADGKTVRMYTCGPTVYNFVHIGNLRTFTFQDILRRWLRARGFALHHVMNITDVEDKIIRTAMAAGQTIYEYTKPYETAFLEDCKTIRLELPEQMVRATDHIKEMAESIEALTAKGFTYTTEGSVYYRIAQFKDYGKLSHNDFAGMRAGARADMDEYDKDDARDFVLWKAKKEGEPSWTTSFGEGRPGWHIECSAMAMKYLGDTLDIHAGGIDLVFPHHENEIAQAEAISGKPFARFWLHSEHLLVNGQKMSKSLGNYYTLRDLMDRGYQPEMIRYQLMQVPYRNKLNFTFEGLKAAATSIDRLRNYKLRLETDKYQAGTSDEIAARIAKARADFESSMDDDLNTAGAQAAVFELIRDTNTLMDEGKFFDGNRAAALDFLAEFDAIFDVIKVTQAEDALTDSAVDELVEARTAAKKAKDFAKADQLRNDLLERGIVIEDTREGVRWKRK